MYRPDEALGTSLNHLMIEIGHGADLIRHFTSLPEVHLSEAQFLSVCLWFRLLQEGKTSKPLALVRPGPTIEVGTPAKADKFLWLLDFVKDGTVVSTSTERHATFGKGENWHLLDKAGMKWRKDGHAVQVYNYVDLDHILLLGVNK